MKQTAIRSKQRYGSGHQNENDNQNNQQLPWQNLPFF